MVPRELIECELERLEGEGGGAQASEAGVVDDPALLLSHVIAPRPAVEQALSAAWGAEDEGQFGDLRGRVSSYLSGVRVTHTDEEIRRAARLAEEADPSGIQVDDTTDLRALAEAVESDGIALGVSRQAARERFRASTSR